MAQATTPVARPTSIEEVFRYLHDQILDLRLKPRDHISKAETAVKFSVSRQPVRDVFSQLAWRIYHGFMQLLHASWLTMRIILKAPTFKMCLTDLTVWALARTYGKG